ncbi:MAG: hypothetical protein KH366_17420, partial [Clostridiaceae bacterium]|nr:hypothetical protein [Clostridiaceae bacterium]
TVKSSGVYREWASDRLFFMLGVLVPLNGWNQIPVSFGSSVPVPALVLRHPSAPLFCVSFSTKSQL